MASYESAPAPQPGLEVAHSPYPEAYYPDKAASYSVHGHNPAYSGTFVADPTEKEPTFPPEDIGGSAEKGRSRGKKWWIIGAVVLAVVIAVAVGVGVGVGTRKSKDGDLDSASASNSSDPKTGIGVDSSSTEEVLADGSSLGAVQGAGQLFYQSPSGDLMMTLWSSTDEPNATVIPDVNAKNNTPIASIGWDNYREARVFYLTPNNIVREKSYTSGVWTTGPLSSLNLQAHNQSQLAAFLFQNTQLRLYYQRPNGTIQEYGYDMSKSGEQWQVPTANHTLSKAADGSGLAAIYFPPDQIRVLYHGDELLLREDCYNSVRANDWSECTVVADLKIKCARQSTISAASWENSDGVNDWILYQSFDQPSTISAVAWVNSTKFTNAVHILPLNSINDDGSFAISVNAASENSANNLATVFYESVDGGIQSINWTEANRGWGDQVTVDLV